MFSSGSGFFSGGGLGTDERFLTGGEGGVELRIASAARALTRKLELKRSDASHRLRSGDRFRRYAEISGSVSTAWGEA